MNELSVPLERLAPCLQGVIPSWLATCSAEGVPNVTLLSIVHYVDAERVGLTRQFFNKTTANLEVNPLAQLVVVDPETADQFVLDLRFLHTETEGATFEAVAANLDAVASQTGMEGVFRLRGVDIHRVLRCSAQGETLRESPASGSERRTLAMLDEFVRRLSLGVDYAKATRTALESLEDLFGFDHSILLVADEGAGRLFAVAGNGYPVSSAGAEVEIGVGLIGVAAQRRRVVCVPSVARSRAIRAGIEASVQRSGAELEANEIPLPGLDRVESAAAVPLVAQGDLVGLLYLESERQGAFGPGSERLLRVLGGHLATVLALLQSDAVEAPVTQPEQPEQPPPPAEGAAIAVVYYQADDSVFADDRYVIKGVPGRILWKLVKENAAAGRTLFTNRELRLDERLGLPAGKDNLEARLLVLRKRLSTAGCGIEVDRIGRGRLELRLARPLTLSEVSTSGPMRAAHQPPQDKSLLGNS